MENFWQQFCNKNIVHQVSCAFTGSTRNAQAPELDSTLLFQANNEELPIEDTFTPHEKTGKKPEEKPTEIEIDGEKYNIKLTTKVNDDGTIEISGRSENGKVGYFKKTDADGNLLIEKKEIINEDGTTSCYGKYKNDNGDMIEEETIRSKDGEVLSFEKILKDKDGNVKGETTGEITVNGHEMYSEAYDNNGNVISTSNRIETIDGKVNQTTTLPDGSQIVENLDENGKTTSVTKKRTDENGITHEYSEGLNQNGETVVAERKTSADGKTVESIISNKNTGKTERTRTIILDTGSVRIETFDNDWNLVQTDMVSQLNDGTQVVESFDASGNPIKTDSEINNTETVLPEELSDPEILPENQEDVYGYFTSTNRVTFGRINQ